MQRPDFLGRAQHLESALARMFPAPEFLFPRAAGIDISDSSIKWISLAGATGSCTVEAWGQEPLPGGIVRSGTIQNPVPLVEALKEVKRKLSVQAAHVALPEESAFVFSMLVPSGSTRQEITNLIEFDFETRVPIPTSAAVYDFNFIGQNEGGMEEIGVVVFPREIAESYASAFEQAGFMPLSLELEATSIARAAVSAHEQEGVELLVDFGFKRTGFAVLNRGIPIFTSTVEIGGEAISHALEEKMKLTPLQSEEWKNEQGLLPQEGASSPGLEAVSGVASSIGSEVARHFNYWDTRRNEAGERVTPVSRVLLVGGSANLKGLADYIASRVQAPVERPNLWQNAFTFDEYIPPIDRRASLQYATAIGLALRS